MIMKCCMGRNNLNTIICAKAAHFICNTTKERLDNNNLVLIVFAGLLILIERKIILHCSDYNAYCSELGEIIVQISASLLHLKNDSK